MYANNSEVIPVNQLRPGTALRVPCGILGIKHWGVVGYGNDSDGNPLVWHSQKSDVLRVTSFLEFSGGQICDIVWVPQNTRQAQRVIQRLKSQEGRPWHLTEANCEMVVRWAIEDKAVSEQLAFGALAAIAIVAVIAVAASAD